MVFIAQLVESLNKANRQPSNGLYFHRQRQKGSFLPATVKTFEGISNFTISADIHGLWTTGVTGKTTGHVLKTKHYKTLQLSYSMRVS